MTKRATRQQPDVFRFVSGVSYSARTSQETIKKLATDTAKYLGELNKQLAEVQANGEEFLTSLVDNGGQFAVEEEEEVTSNLLAAEQSLAEVLEQFREMEQAAVCDPELYGHNEELVIEAYKRSISLVSSLGAVTQSIRWAVTERVEDYGEPDGEPMNAQEFLTSLN